jgi:hypothetical protein
MTISNPEPGLQDAYLKKIAELQQTQIDNSVVTDNGNNSKPAEAGE